MINFYKQQKKDLPRLQGSSAGFTLIETLIAIFILTLTVGGLLELAAGGYFSVRYERNQIVADNLLQESLEYIRNTRDTALQAGGNWQTWLTSYTSNGCTNSSGCLVDPYTTASHIRACPSGGCEAVTFYPATGLYGYSDGQYPNSGQTGAAPYLTSYIRTVTVQPVTIQKGGSPDQAIVTVQVKWTNGNSTKTATQSILLTNWQLQS